ncbi:MAG: lipoyl(octanoyl) transferase LipB [Candidatus Kapabacteria bacterium]|nr:lipoyl(octanoyl) transferase LipB [Candidatus Kapabacteria bacterium]
MNVTNWGRIDFETAWRRQRELVDAVLFHDEPDTLVFCEHDPVITLGRTTGEGSVLASAELLAAQGVKVIEIDRGGEATVHNPGQLIAYPIFHLERTKPDLHWFMRTVEQAVIDALHTFGINAGRVQGLTGVWIDERRKICAIGVHCRKWVISHGLALNVNNDLSLFDAIIPCGIRDRGVTSMALELGTSIMVDEVRSALETAMKRNFDVSPK